jgi:hypothetical protein
LETLEEIRKFDSSIFVLLFSSQKEVCNRENRRRFGSFDFLEKNTNSFSMLKNILETKFELHDDDKMIVDAVY